MSKPSASTERRSCSETASTSKRQSFPQRTAMRPQALSKPLGPGVDPSWIGKRASTVPGFFHLNDHGVYGEVAVVPVAAIAEYPANLSYEEGTSIWMQYLTAYGGLIMLGHLTKGDFILITAASSSVGLAAIEIAKAEGATSIAVTRTAAKKADLLKLGADHVIVTDEEDLVARVNKITSGKGARVVFDPIGGKILEALAQAASKSGLIIEYGALAPEPTPYPLFTALSKFLTVRAYTLFEVAANPEEYAKARKYIYDHLAAGKFKVIIDKKFPFTEIVAAHRYMESNAQIGKIVLTL